MKHPLPYALPALAIVCLLGVQGACEHKPSPAAVQAQDAAKSADDRVAQLEKELADLKAGKATEAADPEVVEQTTQAQAKALQVRVAEAKRHAAQRHTEAGAAAKASGPAAVQPATVTVPAQTRLAVALTRDLATDKAQPGDTWEGTLAEEVAVDGRVAWPKGTPVKGVVTQSTPAGRLKSGQGGLGIRLSAVGGNDVEAGTYLVVGSKLGERDAKFIGGTAALGALVGILSSKGHQADHALGGAAIGAAAGTGAAAATADTIIRIPAGKPVAFTLEQPEKVALK